MLSFSDDDDDSIDVADLENVHTSEKEDNHNGIRGSKLSLYSSRRSSSFYAPILFDSTYTLSELDRIDGLNASSSSLPRLRRSSLANSCPDFDHCEASSVAAHTPEMDIPMVITLAKDSNHHRYHPSGPSALQILEFGHCSLNDLPGADSNLDRTQKGSQTQSTEHEAAGTKQCRRRSSLSTLRSSSSSLRKSLTKSLSSQSLQSVRSFPERLVKIKKMWCK